MKAVMISIRPEWCEKIANGRKTLEVRKTKPKLETPFKCYIYCTKPRRSFTHGGLVNYTDELYRLPSGEIKCGYSGELMLCTGVYDNDNFLCGKVIGEFVCDFIAEYQAELWDDETYERIQERYEPDDFPEYGEYEYQTIADSGDDFWKENMLCKASCLTVEELRKYLGGGISDFYGWHISELKIYDTPKALSEFIAPSEVGCCNEGKCRGCHYLDRGNGFNTEDDCTADFDTDNYKPLRKAPQSWCYVEEQET